MSRVTLLDSQSAPQASKPVLDQVYAAFKATPNMFRAVANSPAALKAMWGTFGALGGGAIDAALGEKIAIAVANRNGCEYCLAAHTALGAKAGVTADDLLAAQCGESADARTKAALTFALRLVEQRGQVGDVDVQALRDAGFNDQQLVEIIAHVALNLFTNYVNIALAVPVDFPHIALRAAA